MLPWNRFVRFVSTPEVLERFVTIEKEIVQIEGSVQLNETETEGIGGARFSYQISETHLPVDCYSEPIISWIGFLLTSCHVNLA